MAAWDSSDLLSRFRLHTRTPPASTIFPTDANAYTFLTSAAVVVESRIQAVAPKALIAAPTLMVTADGGKTYTFGTDADGNNIVPMGTVDIYPDLVSVPNVPLTEWQDYITEGDKIRIPNNSTRTFSAGGPYARFITPTLQISAGVAPLLKPVQARELIVWEAVRGYAATSKNLSDMLGYANEMLEGGQQGGLWGAWIQRYKTEWMQEGNIAAWQSPNTPGSPWSQDIYRSGMLPWRGGM